MEALPAADRDLLAATAAAIAARRTELAAEVVAEAYRDPFWEARYGERGRARSLEDLGHNLDQLAAALRLGLPDELIVYHRWLREILVVRGMSTEHLRETLNITAGVLERRLAPEQAGITTAWLGFAGESLVYDLPFARDVAAREEELIEGTLRRLAGEQASSGGRQVRDLRFHLSYLVDASALDRPDLFTTHMSWLAEAGVHPGSDPGKLRAQLSALGAELEERLPEFADAVRQLIRAGISATQHAGEQGHRS